MIKAAVARPIQIAPSILSADFGRLAEEIRAIDAGGADLVHVDVMDGHFVPNLTIGPMIVEVARKATKLPLDVHLMISNADQYIERYAEAGADIIGVHAEACTHLHRTIQAIRAAGKRPCVVLNPATPLDALDYVLDQLAMVLIMSVNPGFGGQSFIDAVLPKIESLRARIDQRGLDIDIEVDGGIKIDNVDRVTAAGANVIVSGSGIFGTKDYAATIRTMRDRGTAAAAAA
jgi:ribulose-phosphate 3-epimerase